MKTLYIDINNTPIEGNSEIEVLSVDLLNDFYYSLGESIKGNVRGISSNIELITDYISSGENAAFINEGWQSVKEILFSDNPEEDITIELPQSYLEWLRYNNKESYRNIYEQLYRGSKNASVTIDMAELCEDTINGSLYRKIRNTLKADSTIEEFVFNDNCVNRKSAIIRKLKSCFDNVGFVPFEKWEISEIPVQESCSENKENFSGLQTDDRCESLASTENKPVRFITFEEYRDEYQDEEDDDESDETLYCFNVLDSDKNVIQEGICRVPSIIGSIPFSHMGMFGGHNYIDLEVLGKGYREMTVNEISTDTPKWENSRNRDELCGYGDSFVSKYRKRKGHYEYDILDRLTKKEIIKNLKEPSDFRELCEGWATVRVEVGECDLTMVLNKKTSFYLNENECVYNDTFTDGSSYPQFDVQLEPIKDNRIITLEMYDNGFAWDNCRVVKIRDEKGSIIKELPPHILIKQSYRYGKALAIDTDTNSLVYIDTDGNIHDLNHYVNGNPFECECLFASNETVCCVKDAEEDYPYLVLKTLDGKILFEEAYHMRFLSDGYIEYTDKHSYKKGLIDGFGNLILYPKYYWIEVLR